MVERAWRQGETHARCELLAEWPLAARRWFMLCLPVVSNDYELREAPEA